jgi:phosphatidylserine/phosphatidylglycerophosphate/cardiolipin synthase-like enzyme
MMDHPGPPEPQSPAIPRSPLLDATFGGEADRLTRTVVRDGNSITFMPSGEQSYAKRWELIEAAEKSLNMVSFSVIKDDTSRRLAQVVKDKVRQGVDVKFICDDGALFTPGHGASWRT